MSLNALADKIIVQLESIDGKIITAELLEKGKDKVKLKIGRKNYTLLLAKLTKESAEIVKKAEIPTMCDFKLVGNFTKQRKEVSREREIPYTDHEGRAKIRKVFDSYKIDTVSGKVTVTNMDTKNTSPKAQLYVVVLSLNKGVKQVIRREVKELNTIEPRNKSEFDVGTARIWHTERGLSLNKPKGLVAGRYSGYIAAVVINGRIAEVKAMPSSYERDLETVRGFLKIPKVDPPNGK